MNFSVHFDDATVARLNKAVTQVGLTRNRIIGRAVQEWLDRTEQQDWPELLKSHFSNPAPDLAEQPLAAKAWRPAAAVSEKRW